jgi:hypothetical protein
MRFSLRLPIPQHHLSTFSSGTYIGIGLPIMILALTEGMFTRNRNRTPQQTKCDRFYSLERPDPSQLSSGRSDTSGLLGAIPAGTLRNAFRAEFGSLCCRTDQLWFHHGARHPYSHRSSSIPGDPSHAVRCAFSVLLLLGTSSWPASDITICVSLHWD